MLTEHTPQEGQDPVSDVDRAVAELEQATRESAPPPEGGQPPQESPWEPPEWSHFEWNGKKIFPDNVNKAKTWLQQGYNYAQRMGEFNKQRAAQESEWKQREAKWNALQKYDMVEQYAQQNPEWWKHVEQAWETREQNPQAQPNGEILALREQVKALSEFKEKWEADVRSQNEAKEDQLLQTEIDTVRKQYPNIDLDSTDGEGITLEMRVLQHAEKFNIPTFRAAFHDLFAPKLFNHARAEGRAAVVQEQAKAAKSGLLGKSPTPPQALPAVNTRTNSYDQLAEAAKAALGL